MPLEARSMLVADVVKAIYSHRPYRPRLGIDKALAEIERGRGSAYDPDGLICACACFARRATNCRNDPEIDRSGGNLQTFWRE